MRKRYRMVMGEKNLDVRKRRLKILVGLLHTC
jgi:hypothetical protein